MADAVFWVTAGETTFGFNRETFLKAYAKNLDENAAAAIEMNLVGLAITQLLEKQDEWSGTSTELLEALGALASEEQRRREKLAEKCASPSGTLSEDWPPHCGALARLSATAARGWPADYRVKQKVQRPKNIVTNVTNVICPGGTRIGHSSHFGTESATSSRVPRGMTIMTIMTMFSLLARWG